MKLCLVLSSNSPALSLHFKVEGRFKKKKEKVGGSLGTIPVRVTGRGSKWQKVDCVANKVKCNLATCMLQVRRLLNSIVYRGFLQRSHQQRAYNGFMYWANSIMYRGFRQRSHQQRAYIGFMYWAIYILVVLWWIDLIFGVLMPLSTIFQLYHGDQF